MIDFLVSAPSTHSRPALVRLLERVIELHGFTSYGLDRRFRKSLTAERATLAARWPSEWSKLYIRRKYALIDPRLRMLSATQSGFRWRDAYGQLDSHGQRRRVLAMLKEASRFGLHDGYVFPIHGRGGLLGALTLAGPTIDLSPVEICLFETVARLAFWRLSTIEERETGKQQPETPQLRFTEREIEVIMCLTEGMTSNEIGRILSISGHTVDWYMSAIQSKLGARNRVHAAALALRYGVVP